MPLPLANSTAQTSQLSSIASASRQLGAPGPLRMWHLASLDAPSVAVSWSLGFAWAAGVQLPRWVPVLLALGTWAVYIGDRLLDVRSARAAGNLDRLRDRHFFHWRHRRILAPLALVAASASAAMIFTFMPAGIRERNSVLAAAALAYFSGVHSARSPIGRHSPLLSKEFLVGVLFTAGCALPVISLSGLNGRSGLVLWPVLVAIAFFAALAWLNCRAIERWESSCNRPHISIEGNLLGLAGLTMAAGFVPFLPRIALLLAAGALSSIMLALLDRMRGRLTPLALRAAADLVLLTPFLLLAA